MGGAAWVRLHRPPDEERRRVNSPAAFFFLTAGCVLGPLPSAFKVHIDGEEQILRLKTRCHAEAGLPVTGLRASRSTRGRRCACARRRRKVSGGWRGREAEGMARTSVSLTVICANYSSTGRAAAVADCSTLTGVLLSGLKVVVVGGVFFSWRQEGKRAFHRDTLSSNPAPPLTIRHLVAL